MVDESECDYGYEYGYDHLYEEEKPADAVEDAGDLDGGDDYGDDEPDDSGGIENVLAMECIMQEVNVRPLDLDIPEDTHGMLKREAKAEALRRYEEAAQSPAEFLEVVATWDKLDQTRERRERYHEVLRGGRNFGIGPNSPRMKRCCWTRNCGCCPTQERLPRSPASCRMKRRSAGPTTGRDASL